VPARPTAAPRAWAALLFAAAAACGVALAWGFTVDDALISTRVAHQLALGRGYRFNPGGPRVDAVTPLGWAHLLVPLAHGSAWQALARASLIGAALWVLAAGALGHRCAACCSGWRLVLLGLVLATCLPLGAWASAGMETALVMALGVLALGPGLLAAACAGLAAAWRPELVPWAAVLAFGGALGRRAPLVERSAALALALGPALAVALVRAAVFGHAAPLAVFAKPSDAEHGLRYALGSVLLSGPPFLLLAPRAWRGLPRERLALAAALGVHGVVLAGVGGDWMPLWRLAMPVLPGVVLLGAELLGRSSAPACLGRAVAVFACAALLHAGQGSAVRAVRETRERMSRELEPLLAGARRVASLDVGWVGAAADVEVLDLAGVTDPTVAILPGGHTSKRLPDDFLTRRSPDALVLLESVADAPSPQQRAYAREVERRLARLRGAERFVRVGRIELDARQSYAVLRSSPEAP
jgi:hypothetical protein